ncbi:MAG: CAP domain-containing protein [Janthinobacterium lividum]
MKPIYLKILLVIPLFFCSSFVHENASFMNKNFSFKAEVLNRINRVRVQGCNCGNVFMPPVAPVVWNDQLAVAAAGHAQDMANQHYFIHESKNGDHIRNRFEKAGYGTVGFQRYVIGENIAQGQQSIEQVNQELFKSENHCKNLMNPAFKEVGVYVYDYYWVEDFGGRYPFDSNLAKQ